MRYRPDRRLIFPHHRVLGREEERALLLKAREGDRAARDELVMLNQGLVVKLVKRYVRYFPIEDLVQEGNLGLLRAIDEFDLGRGFRLSTYAAWWIRHHIQNLLTGRWRLIRVPRHLQIKGGTAAAKPEEAEDIRRATEIKYRLNLDGLPARVEARPRPAEEREWLDSLLRTQPKHVARILELRHGIGRDRPQTWGEIAREVGYTKEWARLLYNKAIHTIKSRTVDV